MKNGLSNLLCAAVIVIAVTGTDSAAQQSKRVVFSHVNVIPMDREIVLNDQNVVISEGQILTVGPAGTTPVPPGFLVIESREKFLIPGMTDMHVHLEGDAWNIMYPPEKRYTAEEIDFKDILFYYVANGITMIDVLSALPEHIPLKEKIARGEMIGPRMILSRMIDAAGKAWPPPICTWINNPEEARTSVIEMHQAGYDRIKVYSFLDRASYDTILATAKRLKMPVDGHIPLSTSVEYVLSSGQSMIAHVEEVMKFARGYTPEQVQYYADLIAKSDVWVTSTLIVHRNFNALLSDSASEFTKPGMEYLHPMGLGIWSYLYTHRYKLISEADRASLREGFASFQKPFVREFHKRGGKLLAGTDPLMPSTLPAISLHLELEELVGAGLTPYEALRVATTNASEFLGERATAGTVEAGKIANLVLLDDNPLDKISNTKKIAGVMTQNFWITRSQIEERLKKIRDSYSTLGEKKSR